MKKNSISCMNLYKVLGISKSATGADIKKAYRQLSKKYHPDICKEGDTAQKFKEIADAYSILKDPQKRKIYDQYGAAEKIVEKASSRKSYKRRTGESLQYNAHVSLYEACFGAEIPVTFTHTVLCENGKDIAEKRETLVIPIPPGCLSGEILRVRGKGNVVEGSTVSGDLFIAIHVDPDERFYLNDTDLETVEDINIAQALIGGKKEIELLDRDSNGKPIKVRLTIPAGSSAGKRLRIPGRGFTKKDGQRGDLFILLNIAISDMSDKRTLIEEFADKIGISLET